MFRSARNLDNISEGKLEEIMKESLSWRPSIHRSVNVPRYLGNAPQKWYVATEHLWPTATYVNLENNYPNLNNLLSTLSFTLTIPIDHPV